MILTLLFLAPLFSDLPKAVLAAIIIDAVVFGMIDVKAFPRLRRVARVRPLDRCGGSGGGLSAGVLPVLSSAWHCRSAWLIYVSTRPRDPAARPRARHRRSSVTSIVYPAGETFPGMAVLRLDGALFFATAEALESRVRDPRRGRRPAGAGGARSRRRRLPRRRRPRRRAPARAGPRHRSRRAPAAGWRT